MTSQQYKRLLDIERDMILLRGAYAYDLRNDTISGERCHLASLEIDDLTKRICDLMHELKNEQTTEDLETQERAIRQVVRLEVEKMMNEGLLMPGRVG